MIRRDNQSTQQRKRNAFTLMEMLVVVAIIVALAGMGGFFFFGQLEESKKKTCLANCKTWANAVEAYEISHGANSCNDLNILKQKGPNGEAPLIKSDFSVNDPWNQPFAILRDGNGVVYVVSPGPPNGGKQIGGPNP